MPTTMSTLMMTTDNDHDNFNDKVIIRNTLTLMKRLDDIWISSILIPCDIWQTNKQHESNLHLQVTSISVAFKLSICWTKASGGDNLMRTKTRSSRMNVATDQTIILGLQIFLDLRSLSSINQKILMT